jgi:hypothetical protein
MNELWIFGFLMALIERASKPLRVILDNDSTHIANNSSFYWGYGRKRQAVLFFCPPIGLS